MKRRGRRVLILLMAAALAAAGAFWYMNARLRPLLMGLASARVEAASAQAMNEAILEVLCSPEAQALLSVRTFDEGGRIFCGS